MHLCSSSRRHWEVTFVHAIRHCRSRYIGQLVQYILRLLHVVILRPVCPERCSGALMIPEILFLVEQICPRTTQIYNLRAAISVLFQTCAFEAVKGVGDSLRVLVSDMAEISRWGEYAYLATADKAFVLVVAKGAFVADTDESCGADVTVAYRTLAVALVAETANGDTCCLATHDQITVSLLVYASCWGEIYEERTGDGAT
jgi:hypothetical protein